MNLIEIIPVFNLPIIKAGDDLTKLIFEATEKQKTSIQSGDIIILTHVIVARAEGNTVDLNKVTPSDFAKTYAQRFNKDPKLTEVVLQESQSIVRMSGGKLITETKHGFVCANSGVDRSNVPGAQIVALLPTDPDRSAQKIRDKMRELTGKEVAIIISDTHGRPLRDGEINIAVGVAGINPLRDRRGETDLFGYTLRIKRTAIADELSSAAELVMGQADEGIPVAIIRGYPYPKSENAKVTDLIRRKEKDLFR